MPSISSPAVSRNIQRIIVLDTETTGVQHHDKIVTLAALSFEGDKIIQRSHYLAFDPRRNSAPEALAVHGWDDWTTRFQDLFEDHASDLHKWLAWADQLVMHNAQFDMHYLQREMRKAGQPPIEVPTFCTLASARQTWPGQRNGLDDCIERIGHRRRTKRHNALEDAFYTASLYLHLRGGRLNVPEVPVWPIPRNYRVPDAHPGHPLPRRTKKTPGDLREA
jgi:DNA polymerase III subunit epsilon